MREALCGNNRRPGRRAQIFAAMVGVLLSCGGGGPSSTASSPVAGSTSSGQGSSSGASAAGGAFGFTNLTEASGFTSAEGFGGHGIQVADVDADGWLDVYVTNIFDPMQNRPDLLFRNLGETETAFEEIGIQAGVEDDGFFEQLLEDGTMQTVSEESHAAAFADFDRDGDLDLFNAHTWSGNHRLYRNEGDARFIDITESAGIDVRDLGPRGVGIADLDGNGFLDIVVTAWQGFIPNVYLNDGDLRFERSRMRGDPNSAFANQGISVVDVDNDLRSDVMLSAFEFVPGVGQGPIAVLSNDSVRFQERTEFSGLAYEQTTSDFRGSNGFSFFDIDNDADLDVLITGFHGSKLYENNGEGRYSLIERFDGVHYTGAFGDVDNDGDLDMYLAGDDGIYINDGRGGYSLSPGMLSGVGADARSAVFADMNNDGSLDLLIASKQGLNSFFQNTSAGNDWLKVSLRSPSGEEGAIGAEVSVLRDGELVGYRVVQASNGYCSQDPFLLHFGVDSSGTYEVRVRFQAGGERTISDVTPGSVVRVE